MAQALKIFMASLSLNPELPLSEHSVVGLSFVPTAENQFSVAFKRSMDIRWSEDAPSDALLRVMLLRLSQLATSQVTNGKMLEKGTKLGSQILLLGKPVKHPVTKKYVLQIDIIQVTNATLDSTEELLCLRTERDISIRTFFCQELDVVKKGTFFAFDATPRLRQVDIEGVDTLLTTAAVIEVLTAHASASPPASPPSA